MKKNLQSFSLLMLLATASSVQLMASRGHMEEFKPTELNSEQNSQAQQGPSLAEKAQARRQYVDSTLSALTPATAAERAQARVINQQASSGMDVVGADNQSLTLYNPDFALSQGDRMSTASNPASIQAPDGQRTMFNRASIAANRLGNQLASAGRATGRAVSKTTTFTAQKVQDLYNQLPTLSSLSAKLSFGKTATIEALKENVNPAAAPTAEQKAGVTAAANTFMSRLSSNMSLKSFNSAVNSLRQSIASLFGRKSEAAPAVVGDSAINNSAYQGTDLQSTNMNQLAIMPGQGVRDVNTGVTNFRTSNQQSVAQGLGEQLPAAKSTRVVASNYGDTSVGGQSIFA